MRNTDVMESGNHRNNNRERISPHSTEYYQDNSNQNIGNPNINSQIFHNAIPIVIQK